MFPDEPTDEEREEKLPQDGDTPFRPADDNTATSNDLPTTQPRPALDDTHPATDTDIAPEEVYDSGIAKAAEASEPQPSPPPQTFPLDPEDTEEG